jgi:hypothetical protein
LREFSVSFPFFPWLPPIKPFNRWGTADGQTRQIDWYVAYNQVKHDRETNFRRANLGNAFNAVTACAVMMWAQFGHPNYFGQHSELRYFFHLEAGPGWAPSDAYTLPYEGHSTGWTAVPYDFAREQKDSCS